MRSRGKGFRIGIQFNDENGVLQKQNGGAGLPDRATIVRGLDRAGRVPDSEALLHKSG